MGDSEIKDDLLALFPEAASIIETLSDEVKIEASSRAMATQQRREMRRAKSEAVLMDLLPPTLEAGCSWHVISAGDIDARSYIEHVLKNQRLDYLLISSWCMAMEDVKYFVGCLETGQVGKIDFYLGEIFPSQYPDEMLALEQLSHQGTVGLKIFRNHSKVMAGYHAESGYYVVIESSANINTNPRTEQTAIHRSEDLFWHYKDFFDGIISIHKCAGEPGRVRQNRRGQSTVRQQAGEQGAD